MTDLVTAACEDCGYTSRPSTEKLAAWALARHNCEKHRHIATTEHRRAGGPVRDCPHNGVHEHGTYEAYDRDDCRCVPCKGASAAYRRTLYNEKILGRQRLVDAEKVRRHLKALKRAGLGARRISDLTGVPTATISYHLAHEGPGWVRRHIAGKLLALDVEVAAPAAGHPVDATGSRRRLQALAANGWTLSEMAANTDLGDSFLCMVINGKSGVSASARVSIKALYDLLWDQTPTLDTPNTRAASTRWRNTARRNGWVPPQGWDDDEIDDPTARPHGHGEDRPLSRLQAEPDEVAVLRAVAGEDVRLNRAERLTAVQELHSRGLNDSQIGRTLRVHPDQVLRDRRRLNLPANPSLHNSRTA